MIEYSPINHSQKEKNDVREKNNVEGKVNSLGFSSDEQERMWMEQVRRECTNSYINRIR